MAFGEVVRVERKTGPIPVLTGVERDAKPKNPVKVGALSPAHSWGLAGLERIRKHTGKAASSSQVHFCWPMLDPATSLLNPILLLIRVTLEREGRSGEASVAAQALPAAASLARWVPVVKMQASQRLQGPPAPGALSA